MKIIKSILFISILMLFTQCQEDCGCDDNPAVSYGKVMMHYHLVNGNDTIALGDVFPFDGLNEFSLDKVKFHLANMSFKGSTDHHEFAEVALIDFEQEAYINYEYSIPVGSYVSVHFGAGLDAEQNASDPNDFDIDHPLSLAQGMYWSWAMKYRFAIFEGKAHETLTVNDSNNILMAYHPGADEFYTTYSQNLAFTVSESEPVVMDAFVNIDVVYNTGSGGNIDIPTEFQTHTTPDDYALAQKFQQNLGESISFQIRE